MLDLKKVNLVIFVITFFSSWLNKNIARKDVNFLNLATTGKMEQLTLSCYATNARVKEQALKKWVTCLNLPFLALYNVRVQLWRQNFCQSLVNSLFVLIFVMYAIFWMCKDTFRGNDIVTWHSSFERVTMKIMAI